MHRYLGDLGSEKVFGGGRSHKEFPLVIRASRENLQD